MEYKEVTRNAVELIGVPPIIAIDIFQEIITNPYFQQKGIISGGTLLEGSPNSEFKFRSWLQYGASEGGTYTRLGHRKKMLEQLRAQTENPDLSLEIALRFMKPSGPYESLAGRAEDSQPFLDVFPYGFNFKYQRTRAVPVPLRPNAKGEYIMPDFVEEFDGADVNRVPGYLSFSINDNSCERTTLPEIRRLDSQIRQKFNITPSAH